jgi:tetratricopeptide (TPR) repeat protein
MGRYYLSFSEYGKAIPYFEKALVNGDQNSDYHYYLAICLFNTKKQEEAISVLLKGEKVGVASSAYHLLIARLHSALGEKDNAIDALNRGLALYPIDRELKRNLEALSAGNQ